MSQDWAELIVLLESAGVMFAPGLTDEEVSRAEERYDFCFPPDLREFLQTAFPKHFPFANWRSEDEEPIRESMSLPLHGIMFDVERNEFWLPEWGPRPPRLEDARLIVEEKVSQAPRLIPIYAHRMMPDRPSNDRESNSVGASDRHYPLWVRSRRLSSPRIQAFGPQGMARRGSCG